MTSEQRTIHVAEAQITALEAEVRRYKSTIAKMEKQWREATSALNDMKLNENNQIKLDQIQKLKEEIIQLKTEKQVLKLKLHNSKSPREMEAQKQVTMGDIATDGSPQQKTALQAAQQKMAEMQTQIMEVEQLKVRNQKLLEDLTMSQNQERAAKEKSEHLELDLKKLEKKLELATGSEDAEPNAQIKELQDEKEHLQIELQDKQNDIFILTDLSKKDKTKLVQFERRLKSYEAKLKSTEHDPQKLIEQRDLLIDLKQKNEVYEREIKLMAQ